MQAGAKLPASLFLNNRPDYVARWPLYGPTASNNTPVVNNPPTGEFLFPTITALEEGYTQLYFLVDAKDPDRDNITSVTLSIDGVLLRKESSAPFEWGQINHVNQTETQGLLPGSHLFEAEILDARGAVTTISTTLTVKEKGVSYLSPIHDAFLQATTPFNTGDLRVEAGNRVSYLKFDVSSLQSSGIEYVELELTVSSDEGNGTLKVYKGNGDSWLETNLSTANASTKASLASQLTGAFELEKTYKFSIPVSFFTSAKHLNLIVEMDAGGNDVSFASKENEFEIGPRLKVKTKESIVSVFESLEINRVVVYPNPSRTGLFHLSNASSWQVYTANGQLIQSGLSDEINLGTEVKGLFILRVDGKAEKLMLE
jgi:hypothetical protein